MAIKIILYEDNFSLRESLSELLAEQSDFELLGAYEHCLNIITQIQSLQPDIILMDIGLPGMSGIEAAAIARRLMPAVEILILTVFEDDEKVFDALTAGASGYLLKKTNPEKLIDAIRDIHLGGVAMSPGIARKVLGYFAQKQQRAMQLEKLSAREQEILQELANGNSQKMIAHELGISLETVKTHIKRIYEKLQVHSLAEAVAKVFLNK